jgi:hypothetical protein
VHGSNLWSSLDASNASAGYVVLNRSPYDASLTGNYWGDAFEAVTGTTAVTGLPEHALSSFIYDVYTDANLGEVLFAPLAAAPPPPSPTPPPSPPSPPPLAT